LNVFSLDVEDKAIWNLSVYNYRRKDENKRE
jgi:hypothetical protein